MNLHHLIGDATEPIVKPVLICHVCNSTNGWGRGFVLALSSKNKEPENAYHRWYAEDRASFVLGAIQIVPFADKVWVANMIAQKGTRWEGKIPPIRYDALEQCLNSAYKYAKDYGCTLHAPRFGADLAGGSWDQIEAIIKKAMIVETYIYTLESQKNKWPNTLYENIPTATPVYITGDPISPRGPDVEPIIKDDSSVGVEDEPIGDSTDLNNLFK